MFVSDWTAEDSPAPLPPPPPPLHPHQSTPLSTKGHVRGEVMRLLAVRRFPQFWMSLAITAFINTQIVLVMLGSNEAGWLWSQRPRVTTTVCLSDWTTSVRFALSPNVLPPLTLVLDWCLPTDTVRYWSPAVAILTFHLICSTLCMHNLATWIFYCLTLKLWMLLHTQDWLMKSRYK